MLQPKVYIVILYFNGSDDTIECLESLKNLNYSNFEIVLVDNDSTNFTKNEINNWLKSNFENKIEIEHLTFKYYNPTTNNQIKSITNIISKINGGFASGNNIGLKYAESKNDYDFVWIINNDTILEKNSLLNLVNFYNQNNDKKIGIIGSKVLYHNSNILQCAGGYYFNLKYPFPIGVGSNQIDNGEYDKPIWDLDYILGASMFIPKSFILMAGLMSEEYFLYFEEYDWIKKANQFQEEKWITSYCHSSIIYHKEGSSTGGYKKGLSSFSEYHYFRSRRIFINKFEPKLVFQNKLLMVLMAIKRLLRGKIKNSISILKNII